MYARQLKPNPGQGTARDLRLAFASGLSWLEMNAASYAVPRNLVLWYLGS